MIYAFSHVYITQENIEYDIVLSQSSSILQTIEYSDVIKAI